MDALVRVQRDDGVAAVRLCNASRRNALSEALRDALEDVMQRLEDDDTVGVVILTGGERVFSSGFDLDEVAATRFATFGHRVEAFNRAVHGFGKPLITAVSGPALAGGCDLALAGDIVVASDTATFGHPEVRFGVPPSVTKLWPRVGLARARELALTGRTVAAHEAREIGLVDRVVPVTALLATAAELAEGLLQGPVPALRAVKRFADRAARTAELEVLAFEAGVTAELVADPDTQRRLDDHLERLRSR